MKTVKGNILEAKNAWICHQVNCQGVMGAGIAKAIADKWPVAKQEYKKLVKEAEEQFKQRYKGQWHTSLLLGAGLSVEVDKENNVAVVHMLCQDGFGRDRRYTAYPALALCLKQIGQFAKDRSDQNRRVCFPYKVGCGLAGGDWNLVKAMIEFHIPDAEIWKLEK